MNRKGFTLVELIAVIVILAVISLIAIPLIMNVIETSKKGAIKDSAYGLISASEAYVANNLRNGLENNVKFTCLNNKCVSDDDKEISFKGKVSAGTLIISTTNKVLVCVDDGEYYAVKLENEEKVTNGEGTCGAYEEANGTFEIISDIDALRAQYEAEIKQLKEDYDAEITDLKENGNKVIYLGTGTSFDLNALKTIGKIPENIDLSTLTNDNFIVGTKSAYRIQAEHCSGVKKYSCTSSYTTGFSMSHSYNPVNGILSVSGTGYSIYTCIDSGADYCRDRSGSGAVTPFAYLIMGEIK